MELKCLHCNEVFKKNDLDKNSKKELENHLKEIEKSLYSKIKDEISKKYKEELKKVEAEKKEEYQQLEKFNQKENDSEFLEHDEEYKYAISEEKQKIAEINQEIWYIKSEIKKAKKDFLKYSKLLKNEIANNPITLFLNQIQEAIHNELKYLDIDADSPYNLYFSSTSWIEANTKFIEEFKIIFERLKKLLKKRMGTNRFNEDCSLILKTSFEELKTEWGGENEGAYITPTWYKLSNILNNENYEKETLCKDTIFEYLNLHYLTSFIDYHWSFTSWITKNDKSEIFELIKYPILFKTIPIIKRFENKYPFAKNLLLILKIERIIVISIILKINLLHYNCKERMRGITKWIENAKKNLKNYPNHIEKKTKELKELEKNANKLKKEELFLRNKLFTIFKKVEKLKF